MKLLHGLDRYLNDFEYRITIVNGMVNINNYEEIIDFSSDLIKVRHNKGITLVKGSNLSVVKMVDDEVLIEGSISSITLS